MNVFVFVFGVALAVFVLFDFLVTVLSANGAGPVSKYLPQAVARFHIHLAELTNRRAVLQPAGVLAILALFLWWLIGLWFGLAVMLWSQSGSVLTRSTSSPADAIETIYFAGYTLSTMGNGDLLPSGPGWRILIAISSFQASFS